jgi:3-hydroxy-9,10-secoandrosta-1,3,5(10)-triene-9,17-dione monooxygenase reductase component
MAISSEHFRSVLGHFASGLTVISSMVRTEPVGLVVQSFCSLSLDPPMVLFCPSKSSTSWPMVAAVGSYCISVLSEGQEAHSRSLGQTGPEKFASVPYDRAPHTGSPRLLGAAAWLDCSTRDVHDGGDHLVVLADVHGLGSGPGERPLAFWRGGYARIAVGSA